MTNLLSWLAGGKIVALMEGGYFMTSLAEGASMTVRTLLGDPCPRLPQPIVAPCPEMAEAIENVKRTLQPFWKCFQVGHVSSVACFLAHFFEEAVYS